jgi:lysophospholipase L1-like esterase
MMKSLRIAGCALLAAGTFLLPTLTVFAGNLPVWPPPTVPPGGNPAIIPAARDDWMVHFQKILDDSKKGEVNLIFDGDSITDGWQARGKEVWEKYYGKLGAVDDGIGGDRTENVLWRLEDGQVDGLKPKLVAIMIGTNNLSRDTDDQIAAAIEKIVEEYRQRCPDAVILLQGIFPRGQAANNPMRARIKNINGVIAKLGDGKKVIYMDFGDKFLQPDGTLSPDIMPDFLHPSPKGYEIWATAIAPVIAQVFGTTPAATP